MNTLRKQVRRASRVVEAVAFGLVLLVIAGCGSTGVTTNSNSGGSSGTPAVSVNPSSLAFGNVTVGTTSTKTVIITNTGSADLVVSAVTLTGAGYSLSPVSFPLTISAGSTYTASINFAPQTAGSVTGSATITSNATGSPTTVSFTGTGVTTATPAISLSPTSLSFGNVTVGSSGTKTVAITNSGNASLVISAVNITGSGFSVSSLTLPLTIIAGSSYTASFAFNPQTTGTVSGSATIASNAGGSSPVISLSGTGVSAPVGTLNISPSTLSFGNVAVGSTSTQNTTLSNSGNANVVVSSISVTGSGFSTNATTPFTIVPGGSTTLSVIFAPQATGAVSGNASLAGNANNSPTALSFSGTGVTPHSVDLSWTASTSTVAGYNIYRGSQTGGPYQRLNSTLSPIGYTDSTVVSGQSFFYVVTAVDSSGNESGYSNEASAVIP